MAVEFSYEMITSPKSGVGSGKLKQLHAFRGIRGNLTWLTSTIDSGGFFHHR